MMDFMSLVRYWPSKAFLLHDISFSMIFPLHSFCCNGPLGGWQSRFECGRSSICWHMGCDIFVVMYTNNDIILHVQMLEMRPFKCCSYKIWLLMSRQRSKHFIRKGTLLESAFLSSLPISTFQRIMYFLTRHLDPKTARLVLWKWSGSPQLIYPNQLHILTVKQ